MEAGWTAFNARRLDDFVQLYTEDVDFRPAVIGEVEGAVYEGHAGLRKWWADLDGAFDDLRGHLEQAIALGDHMLGVVAFEGRSRSSGVPVAMRRCHVLTLRGDRVSSFFSSTDAGEAMREFARRLSG